MGRGKMRIRGHGPAADDAPPAPVVRGSNPRTNSGSIRESNGKSADPAMVRPTTERILLIGDARSEVEAALSQAAPAARVTSVGSVFDGIAEMAADGPDVYSTVIAAARPIDRRAEAAVRTLRTLAGAGRLILFGGA